MIAEAAGLSGGLTSLAAGTRPRTLCSVTVELAEPVDPCAEVLALRRAGEPWFCWEQPDAGFALGAVGAAFELVGRGPERVRQVSEEAASIGSRRVAEEPGDLPAGAGPVWVGGLAFTPDGAGEPHWSSFAPAKFVLPELALVRHGDRTWLTICSLGVPAGDSIASRLELLGSASIPPLDPPRTGRSAIRSVRPPELFEAAVGAAVERIAAGGLEKVVLAREVVVEAPRAHDPAALFGAVRELFPSCFCFCVGTGEAAFLGASPELLIRRRGAGAATVALAASTRRSADPSVDDHLGEQLRRSPKERSEHQIVVRRIERALRPHSVWVEAEPEPGLVKVANIQHLATPIHAQLAEPRAALDLAGLLHPTPAVGGEPREAALETIAELEEMDRGWYASPVGWMDVAEDGDFCVALRSALLRDRTAHAYAGVGLVAASDPAAELAETELKLDALLPLLTA